MFISVFDPKEYSADLLGGKGHGLWFMQQRGINVPPALIIPTSVCLDYQNSPDDTLKAIEDKLPEAYAFFATHNGGIMPLLSVRSGAKVSMPGMMDTILNVGLDSTNKEYWIETLGEKCAMDCAKRLVVMYGSVVHGLDRHALEACKSVKEAVEFFKKETGCERFPAAKAQLLGSIEAVFQSWNNQRAIDYRTLNKIDHKMGTAVVLQAMVFGNLNNKSATGVLFTRCPSTGRDEVMGEFLVNAQGEDVVAGIRTPKPLSEMAAWDPVVAAQLMDTVEKLETVKKDIQDVEFTIQDGKLYLLQTRSAKRSPRATVKVALDLMKSGLISLEEMLSRVTVRDLDLAAQPIINPNDFRSKAGEENWTGIPACSGVAVGKVVLTSADAVASKEPCILVTKETSPDDIMGMNAAVGILTMTGGATSHAAVVARGMNKPCVTGLSIPMESFEAGDSLTICGSTGRVWMGALDVIEGSGDDDIVEFNRILLYKAEATLICQPWNLPKFSVPKLVLDCQSLLGRPKEEIVDAVEAALKVAQHVILDLTLAPRMAQNTMWAMLGIEVGPAIAAFLGALKGYKKDVSLMLDPEVQSLSAAKGFHCILSVTDLEQAVVSNGGILWSGGNTAAIVALEALWAKAGMPGAIRLDVLGSKPSYVQPSTLVGGLLK